MLILRKRLWPVGRKLSGATMMGALASAVRLSLALPHIVMTAIHRLAGGADYRRWAKAENLEAWWDARTQRLAELIPDGSRVLEFGAGRRVLARLLPANCIYFASDLAYRGPGTIICDLNALPLPDLSALSADIVVFGGVLEYVRDIPSLAFWLAAQAPIVIASYDNMKSRRWSFAWVKELLKRSNFGYMSHYRLEGLIAVFERAGFRAGPPQAWEAQQIIVFEQAVRPPDR